MNLEELEARLKTLVEVHLLKLLPGYSPEDRIAQQLALSMQENLHQTPEGVEAPVRYILVAHPTTLTHWRSHPDLLDKLAEALYTVGSEAGWVFPSRPVLNTVANIAMPEGEIRVLASFEGEPAGEDTRGMIPPAEAETEETIPPNAFLILHGTQIIPLTRSVVNIGRRLDNHVVIDDPRVSRAHAQLRAINGRYVIFDLNSTGGTYVNNQRTEHSVLYPGDVISLAGVTLIFGQDLPVSRKPPEPHSPTGRASSDRPTAVLRPKSESSDR